MAQGWSTDNKYSTKNLVYDLNGNIKTMVQNFNGALADSLTYTYKGNILLGVNDLVNNSASTNDFEDNGSILNPIEGTPSTYEYLYDGNGNMIRDKNKGIDSIKYNFMNLPEKIYFSGNKRIEWIYSVSGAKLRKTVYTNGAVTLTQDYVSGYVYKNNQLDFFFMEQGRVKKLVSGSLRYEYDIKDHLGNTRVCFADTNSDGAAEILEESHYYAFGSRIEGLSTYNIKNKFTYNGKELEDDHGLNWYHYGARYYDPALGRWHSIDAADEYNSPYLYVNNNPIILKDKDGHFGDPTDDKKANGSGGPPKADFRLDLLSKQTKNGSFWVDVWNSDWARNSIPDILTIGIGFTGIAGIGGGSSIEANWVLRGNQASWLPAITTTEKMGIGKDVDFSLSITGTRYLGPVKDITRDMVETSFKRGQAAGGLSIGATELGNIEFNFSGNPGSNTSSQGLGIGLGLPVIFPLSISGYNSNTFLLKDYYSPEQQKHE